MPTKPILAVVAALLVAASPVMAAPATSAAEYELIQAAYGGLLPRVQQLLAQGASPDAQDEYGYTALHWAAQAGWPLTSRALIAKGATVDARDKAGRTPLLLATVRKQVEVVKVLLAAGADPQARDGDGNSPLDYARRKGMPTIVSLMTSAMREPRLPAHPTTGHATSMPHGHTPAHGHATPRPVAHATPAPHGHATPAPHGHATPKPEAIHHPATPKPVAHATPRPVAIHHPATPKPVVRATPAPHATAPTHVEPTAPAVRTTPAAGGANMALTAAFREEVARLYGLYTDHIGMRDPENLAQKGYNQALEDKLEKVFHAIDYGSAASVPRTKLHDARAWVIASRKIDPAGDTVCKQILESVDQLLADTGF